MVQKLKHSELKEYREIMLRKQKYICPLCKNIIQGNDAALDHCHKNGNVRAVLHRSCNRFEGKAGYWLRTIKNGSMLTIMKNLIKYWQKDYSKNPIHPTHKIK